MTRDKNRQFRLLQRPTGRAKSSDFDFVEAPVPALGPGEALIQTLYLSIDPTNRIWMTDMEQYMPPVAIGDVMRGGGIGRVVASNSSRWRVDDLVSGLLGWQATASSARATRPRAPRAHYPRICQFRCP
jgi:NADPH-dependent curcumin reductase